MNFNECIVNKQNGWTQNEWIKKIPSESAKGICFGLSAQWLKQVYNTPDLAPDNVWGKMNNNQAVSQAAKFQNHYSHNSVGDRLCDRIKCIDVFSEHKLMVKDFIEFNNGKQSFEQAIINGLKKPAEVLDQNKRYISIGFKLLHKSGGIKGGHAVAAVHDYRNGFFYLMDPNCGAANIEFINANALIEALVRKYDDNQLCIGEGVVAIVGVQ